MYCLAWHSSRHAAELVGACGEEAYRLGRACRPVCSAWSYDPRVQTPHRLSMDSTCILQPPLALPEPLHCTSTPRGLVSSSSNYVVPCVRHHYGALKPFVLHAWPRHLLRVCPLHSSLCRLAHGPSASPQLPVQHTRRGQSNTSLGRPGAHHPPVPPVQQPCKRPCSRLSSHARQRYHRNQEARTPPG
jgi:hypothetical protein